MKLWDKIVIWWYRRKFQKRMRGRMMDALVDHPNNPLEICRPNKKDEPTRIRKAERVGGPVRVTTLVVPEGHFHCVSTDSRDNGYFVHHTINEEGVVVDEKWDVGGC